jgi:hypothetical protein
MIVKIEQILDQIIRCGLFVSDELMEVVPCPGTSRTHPAAFSPVAVTIRDNAHCYISPVLEEAPSPPFTPP